ncbi:MAG: fibronectin type III domain-containing protein [Owenweeksia sp.]|nr:fibronectin type III domain-containing protein [Owenweeksia sp.]
MKTIFHYTKVLLLFASGGLYAQPDSATYTSGNLSTQFQFFTSLADQSYGCTDSLMVSIPAGNFVTAVDVYYQMEALTTGNGWVSDQGSYVELTNNGATESAVTFGDPNWDSAGVFSYARTGLTFANGVSASGQLDFFLHAFRNNSQFPICNNAQQAVLNNTWKIVVHHMPAPTCLPPNGLNVLSMGTNSVQLNWNSGGATTWQIEYGPVGFAPGNGTIVNALSNPFTVTGLAANTNYDFYVRDSCATGDVSSWQGPVSALTTCGTFTAPWSQNFDGTAWVAGVGAGNAGNQISQCWNRPSANNPNFGSQNGGTFSAGTGPSADYSGIGNYLTQKPLAR